MIMTDEDFDLNEGILHHSKEVDFMPTSIDLSGT
jgi:hypothetical protein